MKNTYLPAAFCLFLSVGLLSGCDQIKTIKDYFTGSSTEENMETEQAAVTPAPKTKPAAQPPVADKPLGPNDVARVGGWILTQEQFQQRLDAIKEAIPDFQRDNAQAKAMILEELLRQELIYQDAEKKGMSKNKDIQMAIDEFRRQLIVRQALADLVKDVAITDDEIKKFYDENKEKLTEPGEWRIREIVLENNAAAEQVRNEIIAGGDFAAIAQQKSKAKSASQGGDLGFLSQPAFPAMGEALSTLQAGDISSVFEGPEGFYIMKVEEQKKGRQLALDEIRKDIEQAVLMQKQQGIVAEYIQKLTQDVKVEVNENLLK